MIPVLIGAAVAGAVAYKILDDEKPKMKSHTKTWTHYLSEEEVPPDVLEKINKKQRERNSKEIV